MDIYELFYIFIAGLPIGLFLALFWDHFEKRLTFQKTKIEGEHILQEAQEKADTVFEQHQKEFNSFQEKNLQPFEKEMEMRKFKLKELQVQTDKRTHLLKLKKQEKTVFF